jgi:PAS domain-containing protein
VWGIVYSVVVVGTFFCPFLYAYLNDAPFNPHSISIASFVRAFTFITSAAFSTLFCITLARFRESSEQTFEIFSRFPRPVMSSNIHGDIRFCNEAARRRLRLAESSEIQQSYFELLFSKERKGASIARYIARMENRETSGSFDLELAGHTVRAETLLLHSTGEMALVTILPEQ